MPALVPAVAVVRGLAVDGLAAARPAPTGALYSVLLVLHVATAVVGFGALALTGVQAGRAVRGPARAGAEGVRRYFRPGVNWAGRALYAVPVLGFALLADSAGSFRASDGFVLVGLVLWLIAAAAAEVVVWPAERRIQAVVTTRWADEAARPALVGDCTRVRFWVALLDVVFVAAVVVMVAKP